MNVFILTLGVFVLSAAGIGIGLLFRWGPLEKRCSSGPGQPCHCQGADGEAGGCSGKQK